MIGNLSRRAAWSITRIAAGNTCPFATPSVWPKPASSHPSAVSGIPTTTPSLKRSTVSTKPKIVHRQGPWRSMQDLEMATLGWVDWFNNRRLLGPIGNIPPAEAKENCYAQRGVLDIVA